MAQIQDDRSALQSQEESVRLTTSMTKNDQTKTSSSFLLHLVRPDSIDGLWEAEDPQKVAQKLLLDYIDDISQATGKDWRSWDENEMRFEANELKWIADYMIHALVFIKTDLAIKDSKAASFVLQVLWSTLDLLNDQQTDQLNQASENRFKILTKGVQLIFTEKLVTKDQAQKILGYARRTIFGHLQLYLTCMCMKKQQSRVKRVEIFTETPQMAEIGDLESNCKEILEQGRAATPEEVLAGETAVDGDQEEEQKADDDEDEIVDPNDPLYGLDQRLAELDLDEDSKNVLKAKLVEASSKIKEGLEKRQNDLDSRLAAMPAGKKR